ncbi:TetR/AcrR family transcriptional regulator [Sphaerochaeta sp. PS]|uniref:TetR/AcrR family transcriptional regulator n=1 Tax=Sphaerochaeta sp. PS TaxID=3076336 RepID=UPI0028A3953A|nr:TetR/AcrR family transcriptional regulator [Sphaerochaeta sp. PS]MDT4761787.1 TetR/AcrR family transcriptional regulator [Sphaerochaeta sp. PS]
MRITKEYDERKAEILDTAETLFYRKGYELCSVNEILMAIGIAKGTFYHYFKSKEEVLDTIVARNTALLLTRANEVVSMDTLAPAEKLLRACMAMKMTDHIDSALLADMHKSENVLLHQKTLNSVVLGMAPLLVTVVEEGVRAGIWSCRFPLEYMQIFLSATLTLTDEGIFSLDAESQMKVMAALIALLEKMVNAPVDSFMQMFMQAQK